MGTLQYGRRDEFLTPYLAVSWKAFGSANFPHRLPLRPLIEKIFPLSKNADWLDRAKDDASDKAWKLRTIDRIRRADVVFMPLFQHSWLCPYTLFEISVSGRLEVPLFGLACGAPSESWLTPFEIVKLEAPIITIQSRSTISEILRVLTP